MAPYLSTRALAACMLLTLGCATTLPPGPGDPVPAAPAAPARAEALPGQELKRSNSSELQSVRRMLAAGEYATALPRLMRLASERSATQAGKEAHYYLGLTYFQIGDYWESREHFNTYLALAPDGHYAAQAKRYAEALDSPVDRGYVTPDRISEELKIALLEIGEPETLAEKLRLADLHWKNSQYQDAAALYGEVLEQYPQLANDMTIRTRVEPLADGSLAVLSPAEVTRRQAEAEPLLIFGTSSFRSGRFQVYARGAQDIYYVVTGRVVNRSKDPLHDVQVQVTIYGFGNMIYDTRTVNFGTLRSGDVRPFSVRFENFDNIENISRYETVGTFRR